MCAQLLNLYDSHKKKAPKEYNEVVVGQVSVPSTACYLFWGCNGMEPRCMCDILYAIIEEFGTVGMSH